MRMNQEIKEEWVWIPGYKGHYKVSSFGKVLSLKYGKERLLKTRTEPKGSLTVTLSTNSDGGTTTSVHHLVWLTYVGPLKKGANIDHIDGDKTNNKLSNLKRFNRRK